MQIISECKRLGFTIGTLVRRLHHSEEDCKTNPDFVGLIERYILDTPLNVRIYHPLSVAFQNTLNPKGTVNRWGYSTNELCILNDQTLPRPIISDALDSEDLIS